MLRKLVALSVVFGLIVAEPLPNYSSSPNNKLARSSMDLANNDGFKSLIDYSLEEPALQRDSISLLANIATSLFGYKSSALSLAVKAIGWVVSNAVVIVIGSVATLGFCKLTGKCSLDYDYDVYEPVASFRSLVTPERLVTAERFLIKAVEKYSEESKGKSVTKANDSQ